MYGIVVWFNEGNKVTDRKVLNERFDTFEQASDQADHVRQAAAMLDMTIKEVYALPEADLPWPLPR